jgi:hypothetical protein
VVGVLLQREKILVSNLGFGRAPLQRVSAGEAEVRKCADSGVRNEGRMVQNHLKLCPVFRLFVNLSESEI